MGTFQLILNLQVTSLSFEGEETVVAYLTCLEATTICFHAMVLKSDIPICSESDRCQLLLPFDVFITDLLRNCTRYSLKVLLAFHL